MAEQSIGNWMTSLRRNTQWYLTLAFALVGSGLVPMPSQSQSIMIKPANNVSFTGKDDVQQLKRLAGGVGWDFEPNADTTAGLQQIGIKAIRCINVDPLPGKFLENGTFRIEGGNGTYLDRLSAGLSTCREVGAIPHVIIALGMHPDLQLTVEDIPESQRGIMGSQMKTTTFGPKDWTKFERYIEAYFEYVLITQKMPHARFEVGNEPDIGGSICPVPPKPAMGSLALYEAYYDLYKHVAVAAKRFEASHPGLKVNLGGPALAWGYTFRFGAFNWIERFLKDCGREQVKLDFIGIHYYGNIASLNGEYAALYPSFSEQLKFTKDARDQYCPGTPIMFTEWGASYQTTNDPASIINGNHIGAAWSITFLNQMLESGIDSALYLACTDLSGVKADGTRDNVWGWPSLFTNPHSFGKAYPKAPYHVFDMVNRLAGTRIESTRGSKAVNCFASADPASKTITAIVWNYNYQIPEGPVGSEHATREAVTISLREVGKFFPTAKAVTVKRWLVSETVSNAFYLYQTEGKIDDRALLQQVDNAEYRLIDDQVEFGFAAPPSSVSFLEITVQ